MNGGAGAVVNTLGSKNPRSSPCRGTGAPSSKYVVYATACVYRELYWKITDRKNVV